MPSCTALPCTLAAVTADHQAGVRAHSKPATAARVTESQTPGRQRASLPNIHTYMGHRRVGVIVTSSSAHRRLTDIQTDCLVGWLPHSTHAAQGEPRHTYTLLLWSGGQHVVHAAAHGPYPWAAQQQAERHKETAATTNTSDTWLGMYASTCQAAAPALQPASQPNPRRLEGKSSCAGAQQVSSQSPP